MNENNEGKQPDFKGKGVDVWVNTDKNGEKYLSIKLLNAINVKAFKYPYPEHK